jgi:calcineurin-like phosphoesterase family protein
MPICTVRFIGCLHFGHKAMASERGFQDEFYHDEHIISQWNSVVEKKDLVYILGDVTMENSKWYFRLDELNGRKKVILGNHDLGKDVPELLKYVEEVSGAMMYKGYMLTHIPIHPSEISFCRGNIHAHIHKNELEEVLSKERYKDEPLIYTKHRYFKVDAKHLDFKPITLEELTGKK